MKRKRTKPLPHRRGRTAKVSKKPSHAAMKSGEGLFHGTRRGFGFVTVEGVEGDIFIPAEHTRGALDGDRVSLRYRPGFHRDAEGEVTGVIAARRVLCLGVYVREHIRRGRHTYRQSLFFPDDKHLPDGIPVLDAGVAESGDRVKVCLERRHGLACRVTRTFGPAASFSANYQSILVECGIEEEFSPEALREAAAISAIPVTEEGRERQTGPILTIDGADAKDLDDAVSLVREGEGYLLSVHIADVSEYVRPDTALDRAALTRGTSVYFVDRVVPMLPPALSNGACSLNAGEDKYTLTAKLHLDAQGALCGTELVRSILRSDVRGVYSEINDLFANGDSSPYAEKYAAVYPMLCVMRELYEKLSARAADRGYFDLETAEPYFVLNEQGEPIEILRRERGVSERIIEHFMLTANEGVARLLTERALPCVYRVHEEPPEDKMATFIHYAHNAGLSTRPLTERPVRAAAFRALLEEAREKGLHTAISRYTVRTMAKARYSERRADHFGLALSHYCHFTSPIRRLSDLATHRMIKACLLDGRPATAFSAYARRAAAAATETELAALQAERRIENLYKALWAEKHIGEMWDATISGITAFGVFAELDNTAEGLIPADSLPFGAFCDEENGIVAMGDQALHMADRIRVRIEEVSLPQARIRFALLSK